MCAWVCFLLCTYFLSVRRKSSKNYRWELKEVNFPIWWWRLFQILPIASVMVVMIVFSLELLKHEHNLLCYVGTLGMVRVHNIIPVSCVCALVFAFLLVLVLGFCFVCIYCRLWYACIVFSLARRGETSWFVFVRIFIYFCQFLLLNSVMSHDVLEYGICCETV